MIGLAAVPVEEEVDVVLLPVVVLGGGDVVVAAGRYVSVVALGWLQGRSRAASLGRV